MKFYYFLLKPKNLKDIVSFLYPLSIGFGISLLILAAYYIFTIQDVDYQQGEIFKFIYIHVPASWWALGFYVFMSICALLGFITRSPQYHLMAKFLSLPGCFFALLSIITGMIWGYFTWGTFWVWDARLTTMFIQMMIYIGYILLVFQPDVQQEKNHQIGSIIILIGFLNLPLIKWSVDWWFTLHQTSSISFLGKNAIHHYYLIPLMGNMIAFFLLGFSFFLYQMKKELTKS